MKSKQHFPNNLRSLRENAGLLQSDVATMLGFASTNRLSKWENGIAIPNILNLFKLSVLYKVPPQELYEEVFREIKERIF